MFHKIARRILNDCLFFAVLFGLFGLPAIVILSLAGKSGYPSAAMVSIVVFAFGYFNESGEKEDDVFSKYFLKLVSFPFAVATFLGLAYFLCSNFGNEYSVGAMILIVIATMFCLLSVPGALGKVLADIQHEKTALAH
jgi:hypothetical protein